MYGYNPEFTWDVAVDTQKGEAPAACKRMAAINDTRVKLTEWLREAVEYQAKYYNRRHVPKQYRVGQEVLLSLKNITLVCPSEKLDYRFLGPFEILEPVGKQAYRLRLPKTLERVHPVFHVSLLELYHRRVDETRAIPSPAILVDGGKEYEVEDILDGRKRYGKMQYLVKWIGYPDSENSWEQESNLGNTTALLQAFKDRPTVIMPSKRKEPRRKKRKC